MIAELHLKFPYRLERAQWYLLFLWWNEILTDEEFENAINRLKEKTGNAW